MEFLFCLRFTRQKNEGVIQVHDVCEIFLCSLAFGWPYIVKFLGAEFQPEKEISFLVLTLQGCSRMNNHT